MQYLGYGLLGFFWFAVLALWPRTIGVAPETTPVEKAAIGEGLYKSSLTKANFGLLGVNFYETSEGRKHWNIRSKFAELHRKDDYAFLKEVTARFFAEETSNVVHTTSDYGRASMDRNEVHLEGNVKVRSQRGYLFTMDRLNYHGKAHEFRSEDQVNMQGPNLKDPVMYIQGVGLRADIDREHFHLHRDVRARKRMAGADWLHVTSRSGEFFTNEQKAIFRENVVSHLPKLEIRSNLLNLQVTDGKEVLSAEGDVELRNRGRRGTAERAHIEIGGTQIVLVGNARIDSKGNEIRGSRIVLYTSDDRIEVEQAQGKASDSGVGDR